MQPRKLDLESFRYKCQADNSPAESENLHAFSAYKIYIGARACSVISGVNRNKKGRYE